MENGISKTYLYLHRKDYVSTANEQERCAISSSMMRERRCPRTSPAIGIHFVRDGPGNGVTSALYTPHATKGKLPKISKVPYAWLFLAGFCLSFISFLFCVRNAPVYLRQPQDELHKIALDSAERRRNARRRQVSIAFDVPADGIDSNLFTLAVSGGASLAPLHSPLPRRNTTIYDDGEMNMSNREGDEANDTQMDQQSSSDSYEYYATDDDYHSNPNASEIRRDGKQCRSASWQRLLFSTCNNLHEFDVQARFSRGDARYLTAGGYREVYLSQYEKDRVVFKAYYWGSNFDYHDLEYMRIDALVNERLSGSSRVVDIYAFCGTGMINEAMLNGDMYQRAAPYGHYGRAITKKEKKEGGLVVSNNFTGIEKLRFSLEMAEAVAVLHSFKDGVIVHDDIKPAQFLWTDDNRIKLNDFNRAVVLQWDDANNEYCPFYSGAPQGVWRSPEEYNEIELNEQIDVWSMGTSMYVLLTGLKPHNDIMRTSKILTKAVRKGKRPYVDPRFRSRSFAENKMIKIMEKCWKSDPIDRIDIFGLVQALREAIEESERYEREHK